MALKKALFMVAVAGFLSGCETAVVAVLDKSLSNATGQECSLARAFGGGDWCHGVQPEEADANASLYCYQTLGTVDCYNEADPYDPGKARATEPPRPLGS